LQKRRPGHRAPVISCRDNEGAICTDFAPDVQDHVRIRSGIDEGWVECPAAALGMVCEARGDNQKAADCYRKVIDFIRDPGDYDDDFEDIFVKRVDKLDPAD
jgi:hypothetical protein